MTIEHSGGLETFRIDELPDNLLQTDDRLKQAAALLQARQSPAPTPAQADKEPAHGAAPVDIPPVAAFEPAPAQPGQGSTAHTRPTAIATTGAPTAIPIADISSGYSYDEKVRQIPLRIEIAAERLGLTGLISHILLGVGNGILNPLNRATGFHLNLLLLFSSLCYGLLVHLAATLQRDLRSRAAFCSRPRLTQRQGREGRTQNRRPGIP